MTKPGGKERREEFSTLQYNTVDYTEMTALTQFKAR